MRILYFGNNVRGSICLEALLQHKFEVVGVVAHADSTALWGETVAEIAKKNGLKLFQPNKVNSVEFLRQVKELDVDLGILSGYSQIVRKDLLGIPTHGVINLHGGLVPEYRGSSITRWVLINNEKFAGVSILQVDEGIDTGDILAEERYQLDDELMVMDVIKKQIEIFPGLLVGVLDKIANGSIKKKKQKRESGCYWHALKPQDGLLSWERMTARNIHDLVRAFSYPYAGAFSFYRGKKVFIHQVKEMDEMFRGISGRICGIRGNGVVVIARDRGLLVERIQFEGQEETWAKGYLLVGTKLANLAGD